MKQVDWKITFNNKTRPREKKVRIKTNTFDNVNAFYERWELALNGSRSGVIPIKAT